jgi:PLP dependent protein
MNNLDTIIENIEFARLSVSSHLIVQMVAVSKYSDADAVKALYQQGQRAFGENKVQDLASKMDTLAEEPLEWHFMGNLQSNKINKLIELSPDLVQSISSLELALEMQKRLEAKNSTFNALLQINSADEESKGGVSVDSAYDIYQAIQEQCPNIFLQGVMSIGAHSEEKALIQKSFERTHSVYENLQKEGATICSMGMSSDYDLAIRCGSNMIRLGSVLFK